MTPSSYVAIRVAIMGVWNVTIMGVWNVAIMGVWHVAIMGVWNVTTMGTVALTRTGYDESVTGVICLDGPVDGVTAGGTGKDIALDIYKYNTNNFIQFLQQTYLWITYHRIITKEEII